jgi:hypothetical protein
MTLLVVELRVDSDRFKFKSRLNTHDIIYRIVMIFIDDIYLFDSLLELIDLSMQHAYFMIGPVQLGL